MKNKKRLLIITGIIIACVITSCSDNSNPSEKTDITQSTTANETTSETETTTEMTTQNEDTASDNTNETIENADLLIGDYKADFEDIFLTITLEDSGMLYLTYTTADTTIENIPYSYEFSDPANGKYYFTLDSFYPEYDGYVEILYSPDMSFPYSYNSLIDNVAGTDGFYSSLSKQ